MHSHEEVKDGELLGGFINHRQNTHQHAVSSSIGMALLLLRKNHFGASASASAEEITRKITPALEDLKNYDVSTHFPALVNAKGARDSLFRRIEETLDRYDDMYLVTQQEEKLESKKYTISLKEVVALVWLAMQCDEKFAQHAGGIQKAKEDRQYRLGTFFQVIVDIYEIELKSQGRERLCHTGIRHDLVLMLNKCYAGIDLILSAGAKVLELLKNPLNEGFQRICKEDQSKKKLLQLLASSADDGEILKEFDPNDAIKKSIVDCFVSHGADAKQAELDKLFQNALPHAVDALDNKDFPEFTSVRAIFTLSFINSQKYSVIANALNRMQNWVSKYFALGNKEHLAVTDGFNKIAGFYSSYKKYLDFLSFVLADTEKTTVQSAERCCDEYFAKIKEDETPPVPEEKLFAEVAAAEVVISKALKKSLKDQVETFFWRLNDAVRDSDQHAQAELYAFILNDHAKEQIVKFNQALLNRIFQANGGVGGEPFGLDLFEFNQILLQAMMEDKWENRFAQAVKAAVDLLGKMDSGEASTVGIKFSVDLKSTSYPDWLIEQLKYFLSVHEDERSLDATAVLPQRPRFLFLLPCQVRSLNELRWVVWWLGDKYNNQFSINKVLFADKVLAKEFKAQIKSWLEGYHSNITITAEMKTKLDLILESLQQILNCIPIDRRLSFIKAQQGNNQDVLRYDGINFLVVSRLPDHEAIEVIRRYWNQSTPVPTFTSNYFGNDFAVAAAKLTKTEGLRAYKWYIDRYQLTLEQFLYFMNYMDLKFWIRVSCEENILERFLSANADNLEKFLDKFDPEKRQVLFQDHNFLSVLIKLVPGARLEQEIPILTKVCYLYQIIPAKYRKEAFTSLIKKDFSLVSDRNQTANGFLELSENGTYLGKIKYLAVIEYIHAMLFYNPEIGAELSNDTLLKAYRKLLALFPMLDADIGLDQYVIALLALHKNKARPGRADFIKGILFSNPSASAKLSIETLKMVHAELVAASSETDAITLTELILQIQACSLIAECKSLFKIDPSSVERSILSSKIHEQIIEHACNPFVSREETYFLSDKNDFYSKFYAVFFLDSESNRKQAPSMIVDSILKIVAKYRVKSQCEPKSSMEQYLQKRAANLAERYCDLAIDFIRRIIKSTKENEAASSDLFDRVYREYFSLGQTASLIKQDFAFKNQVYLTIIEELIKCVAKEQIRTLLKRVTQSECNRDVLQAFREFMDAHSGSEQTLSICKKFLGQYRGAVDGQLLVAVGRVSNTKSKLDRDGDVRVALSQGVGFPSQYNLSTDRRIFLGVIGSYPYLSISASSDQLELSGFKKQTFTLKNNSLLSRSKVAAISENQFAVAANTGVTVYRYHRETSQIESCVEYQEKCVQQILALDKNTLLIHSYKLETDHQFAIYDLTTLAEVRKGALKADVIKIELSLMHDCRDKVFYHLPADPGSGIPDSEYGIIDLITFEKYPIDKSNLPIKNVKQFVPGLFSHVLISENDDGPFFSVTFNNTPAATSAKLMRVTSCSATLYSVVNEEKTDQTHNSTPVKPVPKQ